MQIVPDWKAGVAELPVHRAVVWRRFTVKASGVQLEPSFDPNAEGDFEVELDIAVADDGEATCKGAKVSGPEVRNANMRLPIAKLVREATARATLMARPTKAEGDELIDRWGGTPPGGDNVKMEVALQGMPAATQREVQAILSRERRRRKRTRNTSKHRKRVAELYREARAEGMRPAQWIAASFGDSPSLNTVNNWIGWARDAGELEPARPGRPPRGQDA